MRQWRVSNPFMTTTKMTCWVAASEQLKKVSFNSLVIVIEGFVDAYTLRCYTTVDL